MCHVYTRVKCRDLNIHLKNPLKISSGNIINEVQSYVSRQLRSVQECTVYTLLFVQIAIDKKMSYVWHQKSSNQLIQSDGELYRP